MDKVQNSSQKKIEDILLDEQPHRYVMNGLRNWLQLNGDVALLQSKLKGTLPTRNNVMSLLRTVVIDSSLEQKQTSTTTKRKSTATGLRDTVHRIVPQKRILEWNKITKIVLDSPWKKIVCGLIFHCEKYIVRMMLEYIYQNL